MQALALPIICAGEDLPDPTRPPAELGEKVERLDASTSGPTLQSVLISPARRIAVISGRTVQVGEKFGDARVLKIMENAVVLRSGKNVQVLKLFPGVEKRHGSSANSGKAKIGSK